MPGRMALPEPGNPMRFLLVSPRHALRARVEEHIRDVYAREYDAAPEAFPDMLVALVDEGGRPVSAAGLRLGWSQCFSGCYLDHDVSDLLMQRVGRQVEPEAILEVTTLAGGHAGEGIELVRRIIAFGHELGMSWGVFTATRRLRAVLRRTGFDLVDLAPAQRERLARPEVWGSYYDNDPWVCALEDPHAMPAFAAMPGTGARTAGGMLHA